MFFVNYRLDYRQIIFEQICYCFMAASIYAFNKPKKNYFKIEQKQKCNRK